MSLATYTALQTTIADWLNRTDLATQIPDFIVLAEAELRRRLRRSSTKTTFSITAETVPVPSDMAALRSLSITSTDGVRDLPLRVCTPEMLAERKARAAGTAERPDCVAIMAGNLVFAPAPDQTYTANIFYFTQLTALSGSVPSNAILSEAPDAYLYGALLQAEPYLEHDDRVPVWQAKFDAAIDQLNWVRSEEEYAASTMDVRLPRIFG